jgi:hypothetical protein
MTGTRYPNLGFDPCPGDLDGYRALAAYASRSATALADAVRTLGSAGSEQWRGQAADAFRAHVHDDVLPLAGKAADSVGQAAAALREWALTLSELQDEARALDLRAAPYRTELAALPGGGTQGDLGIGTVVGIVKLTAAQRAQAEEANTALSGITAQADDIHARYLAAVAKTGSQLQDAGNMAPQPPGLFSSLWHDVEHGFDDTIAFLSHIVHDKALLEFISSAANVVATVAALLALIPPLSVIMAPIALGFAVLAMGADALNAMFDGGSWAAVALDAVAVVSDAGWMKAASKLGELYKDSELTEVMTKAPTWKGLAVTAVSKIPKLGELAEDVPEADRSVMVAPGMFRMIGASLKAAAGDDSLETAISAVKDLDHYGKWRAVDIVAGQSAWAFSAAGIEAIPGNVRDWVGNIADGKPVYADPAGN